MLSVSSPNIKTSVGKDPSKPQAEFLSESFVRTSIWIQRASQDNEKLGKHRQDKNDESFISGNLRQIEK